MSDSPTTSPKRRHPIQIIASTHPSRTSVSDPTLICQNQIALFNKVGISQDPDALRSLAALITCTSETGDITKVDTAALKQFLSNFVQNIDSSFQITTCNIAFKLMSNKELTSIHNIDWFSKITSKLDDFCTQKLFKNEEDKAEMHKLAPLMQSLAQICSSWTFPDSIVLPLSSFVIRSYFQKASSGALQSAASSALCELFRKQNADVRSNIITEVVAEGKMLVGNQRQVILPKGERKAISALSRLCIELVQCVAEGSKKSGESEEVAKTIITKLISDKSKNNPYLETFTKDISTLLYHPMFPAAELFVNLLMSIIFIVCKDNEQMSKICINSIATMVTAISRCKRETMEKKMIPVPYTLIKSIHNFTEIDFQEHLKDPKCNIVCEEDSDIVSIIISNEFPYQDIETLISQLLVVLYVSQTQKMSLTKGTSLQFCISKFICDEGEDASQMMKKNHELWKNGNIPFSVDFDWTLDIAYAMNISLALKGTLMSSISSIVLNMLKLSRVAKPGEKVIIYKEFSTIIDLFPSIMESQRMVSEIEQLITSSYATVRESIIEMISSYIMKTKDPKSKFMNIIIHALSDKSVVVVKCALNCLTEINSASSHEQMMNLSSILATKIGSQDARIAKTAKDILIKILLNDEAEAPEAINSIIGKAQEIPHWTSDLFRTMLLKDSSTSKRIIANIITNYSNYTNANKIVFVLSTATPDELDSHCKELLELHNMNSPDDSGLLPLAISNVIQYISTIPLQEAKQALNIACKRISTCNVDIVRAEAQLASEIVAQVIPTDTKLDKILNMLLQRIKSGSTEDKSIKRAIFIAGCIFKYHGSENKNFGKQLYDASMKLFNKSKDDLVKSYVLSAASDICSREKNLIEKTSKMAKDAFESNSEKQQVIAISFLQSLIEEDSDSASYSTFLIQQMLGHAIKCFYSQSSKVRTQSIKLIKRCIEHGVVNPRQVLPNIMSMICADDQNEITVATLRSIIASNEHSIVSSLTAAIPLAFDVATKYGNNEKYSFFSIFQELKQTEKRNFIDEICNFFEESVTTIKDSELVFWFAQSLMNIPIQLQQDAAFIISGLSSAIIESSIASFIIEAKECESGYEESVSMWYASAIIQKTRNFFSKSYPMTAKVLESALSDKKSPAKCVQVAKPDLSSIPVPVDDESTKELSKFLKQSKKQ